jgi:molybdate transport system substrate-binding protein
MMRWEKRGLLSMKAVRFLLVLCCLSLTMSAARAEKITIAAAADLKFAMDEVVSAFKSANPGADVDVVYGSSGNFFTQIKQGAPYDLFFSADIAYPQQLASSGLAASEAKPYASGRIVLWSGNLDATRMTLQSLLDPKIARIAIANPQHAPYGKRAEEALKSAGLWDKIQSKLVYGENIAQTAQFVESGNAQVGIIALSLAVNPELASKGGYWLIPEKLHQPLVQAYIITKRAQNNELARRFADYMASKPARSIMIKYGFVLPGEASGSPTP